MTPEQALQNLENLLNVAIQRGLFQTANDVVGCVQSIDVLRPHINQMHLQQEGALNKKFTVTSTNGTGSKVHIDTLTTGTTTKFPDNSTINNT